MIRTEQTYPFLLATILYLCQLMLLIQYLIISIIALVALVFLIKKMKAQLTSNDCESGCGKCGIAKSFDDIHG